MVAANSEDLGASVAILALVLVEEKRDATLSIIYLPLRGRDRHAERNSEGTTDMVGRVGVVGDAQKDWT